MPGQDCKDKTFRVGKKGDDSHKKDSQNRTGRKGQAKQDSHDGIPRTGLPSQNCYDSLGRTERSGKPGEDI
jgi:hypothetical protein